MKVKVEIQGKKKVVALVDGAKVEDVIRALGLHPDMYVPIVNNKVVPVDYEITNDTKIKLLKVISGG